MISWIWIVPTFFASFAVGYWLGGRLPAILDYFRHGSPIG
jgi:hypothetical protein